MRHLSSHNAQLMVGRQALVMVYFAEIQ